MVRKLLISGIASLAISPLLASAEAVPNERPIDSKKWFHQTTLPKGTSWFSNEQQHYTNRIENSSVSNGVLTIKAKKEIFKDQGVVKKYTSARLNSKFAFTYGRVEVRAKMPHGYGTWPAIWMLPKDIKEKGAYFEQKGFGKSLGQIAERSTSSSTGEGIKTMLKVPHILALVLVIRSITVGNQYLLSLPNFICTL